MSGFMTYFGGDSTGFMRTVKGMEQAVGKMSSKMSQDMKSAIGGFVGYQAFKTLIGNVIATTSAIHNFAKQQNISYEGAQRLGKAAKENGQAMEDFGTVLNKLAGSREAAASIDDKMVATFGKFGVTMSDLQNPMISNYDLIVKIGKALNGMKIDAGTQAAFRDLFGRGGAAMVNSMKLLGQQKPLTLVSDADVEKIHEMERSVARMQSNWTKKTAGPIATVGNFWSAFLERFDEDAATKLGRISKMFGDYSKAHPDEAEQTQAAFGDLWTVARNSGIDDPAVGQALLAQAHNSFMKHGQAETKKIFGADVTDQVMGNIANVKSARSDKAAAEKLFIDERSLALVREELRLHEMIRKSEIDKLEPAERALELRRQANAELFRAEILEEMGLSVADETEAVKARQNALELNDQAYGIENKAGGGLSRPDKMNIDEMAKNNLSLGIKAYEPMIDSTRINTVATQQNTAALGKTTEVLKSIQTVTSVDPWS